MELVEAKFYKTINDKKILCTLCPRACKIGEKSTGFCSGRTNINHKLYTINYGKLTSINIDPIEKKPLNHFLPGTISLSVGTAGCNLGCKYCQNWSISKSKINDIYTYNTPPENLVEAALKHKCSSISYTYNEPTILAEYVMDTSKTAREKGLKNVMVTNGYVAKETIPYLYEFIDAANVDLKSFDDNFYKKWCDGHLKPVLDTIVELTRVGVFLEITTLLIPGLNDSDETLKEECKWIVNTIGSDVPVHFSAFHPDYQVLNIDSTTASTLQRAKQIAHEIGIRYVYEGNVMGDGNNTYCPSCHKLLIHRVWHDVIKNYLSKNSICSCGYKIPVVLT